MLAKKTIALLLAAFFFANFADLAGAQSASESLRLCRFKEGDDAALLEKRIRACKSLIGSRLVNQDALYHLIATFYHMAGEEDLAVENYSRAITLNPKAAFHFNGRAQAFLRKGEVALAIADLNRALQLNPNEQYAHLFRGMAYRKKGALDAAIADFTAAMIQAGDADRSNLFWDRGEAYDAKGEFDRAISDYSEALRGDPKSVGTYVARGNAFAKSGRYGLAIDDYNRALELDPNESAALQNRERALEDQRKSQAPISASRSQPSTGSSASSNQARVVLYPPDGQPSAGIVIWHTEKAASVTGPTSETAIVGDVQDPAAGLALKLLIRRNTDARLPASYTIEMTFLTQGAQREVENVTGIAMSDREDEAGSPLEGLTVKVVANSFLTGLSAVDADMRSNLRLLRERRWFVIRADIVGLGGGRNALLAIEKGATGQSMLNEALAAWSKQ